MQTDIFGNSNSYYFGDDIHIIRSTSAFSLASFFNTTTYDFEFLPQLWGSAVVVSEGTIPAHNISSIATTKLNGTSGSITVSVNNILIDTLSGSVTATPFTGGTQPYYVNNILFEVRACEKGGTQILERTYIRVHIHNKITAYWLSPCPPDSEVE